MWISVKDKTNKPKVEQDVLVALVEQNPRTGFEQPQVGIGCLEQDGSWTAMVWGLRIGDARVQFWQEKPVLPNEMLTEADDAAVAPV